MSQLVLEDFVPDEEWGITIVPVVISPDRFRWEIKADYLDDGYYFLIIVIAERRFELYYKNPDIEEMHVDTYDDEDGLVDRMMDILSWLYAKPIISEQLKETLAELEELLASLRKE